MTKSSKETRDQVLKQKEFLAAETIKVAQEALGLLADQIQECSTRDLVSIFSSAVKVHRDIVSDIVVLSAPESKDEELLAKEYDGKVGELLKRLQTGE
jgi:DNA polymerase III gamma/tau subunit